MKTSKGMQEIVTKIIDKHGVDLSVDEASLRLDLEGFAPLIITRVYKNLMSVGHYQEYGDYLIGDPEIIFFTGYDEWVPTEISQTLTGHQAYAVTTADGEKVGVLYPNRQAAIADFAEVWAKKIEEQGWLENGNRREATSEVDNCYPRNQQPPSLETLMAWEAQGICEATDGCVVEPDGTCPHGCRSWLIELGLI